MRALRFLSLASGAPILAVLLAAGCVENPRPLWPTLTGEPPATPYVPAAAFTADWPAALDLNDGDFQPAALSAVPPAEDGLAETLSDLHGDLTTVTAAAAAGNRRLQELRGAAIDRSQSYVAIVAGIDGTLRVDPDPGDPELQRSWRQAQSALDRLASDDKMMVRLIDQITANGESATEIAEELRTEIDMTAATPGERQTRDRLLSEADATAAQIAAKLAEAQQDLATRRAYVTAERANLQILRLAIANGEPYGVSLANRAVAEESRAEQISPPTPGDNPLVVIRFDDANVRYGRPLYRAATLALERRADALFTLVAVAPDEAAMDEARRNAVAVRETLLEMGLPATQLADADWIDPAATGTKVHVYVR